MCHLKRFLFVMILLLSIFEYEGLCDTYYISPSLEVPIRRGTDLSRKIIAILKNGTKVELIEEDGTWAKVRTPKGKEGWILKRFLTTEPPAKVQVERLKQQNRKLLMDYKNIKEQLNSCSKKDVSCQKELEQCMSQKESITKQYQNLKEEAANVIETKKLLIETQKALEKSNAERIKLKQQLNSAKASTNIKWFLAGGGVLLVGWILGMITNNKRKKRLSLL